MRKDKQKAEELRRAGHSYKQIHRILGVPTATLSDWFRDQQWSIDIRDRLASTESSAYPDKLKLLIAAIKRKYDALHVAYREEALAEFPLLKHDPLFVAGLMLYWGEGDKNMKNSAIRLTNSEPGMIKVFNLFLSRVMKVPEEKITISLILYPDLLEEPMKRFWSASTDIPLVQFRKSVYIVGRHPTRRLSYGVGNIRVGGRKYKEKLLEWIKLCEKELLSSHLH